MRPFLLAATALAVPILVSAPVAAAPILITAPSTNTVALSGVVDGTSLSASAVLTVLGFTATQLTIGVSLTNTVASATDGQNRLVSFGFDLIPDGNRTLTGATSGGGWDVSINNVNITNGTRVDVCAWDGNTCTGGANQGVGETLTESFTLTLTGSFTAPLSMDAFTARYQSIGDAGGSGIIGVSDPGGGPGTPIPEPITLSLFGMALLGLGAARRMVG